MRRLRLVVLALLLTGCATTKTATRERPRRPPPDASTASCSLAGSLFTLAGLVLRSKYGDDGDVHPSPARYK